MAILVRPVTAVDVEEFVGWRYEPPYDAYDIAEPLEDVVAYFVRPDVECHALLEAGELIGFCTFGEDARIPGGDYSAEALDIGLGIRPSSTGLGRGAGFVDAVVAHAVATHPPSPLRVTIATWNERARRVWTRCGFRETARFTVDPPVMDAKHFVVLVRE
jgi:RimJ/RimL family protein N-acetyltransferase